MRFPFSAPDEDSFTPSQAKLAAFAEAAASVAVLEPGPAVLPQPQDISIAVAPGEAQGCLGMTEPAEAVEQPEPRVQGVVKSQEAPAALDAAALAPEEESGSSGVDVVLESAPEPLPPPVPRPPARRKIIAFPRLPSVVEESYRLADPVIEEQPRILDVPEELEAFPTTPLLEGLQLPAAQHHAQPSPDHIELPFQPAPLSRRFAAGLVDCAIVAAATAIFGAVSYKLLPNLATTKPLLLTLSAVPVLLWAVYQYLLTMYAGETAGMRMAKLCLSTFKGEPANWRARRKRAVSLYFSSASIMMGVVWALVDVDSLGWHDRISHTYLIKREEVAHL